MSRPLFALFFCLFFNFLSVLGVAGAQPAPPQSTPTPTPTQAPAQLPTGAELADIRFEGISDPTTESLVQVRLVSRPGVPVADIDLAAERNRVYNLGTFSQVSLSIENRPVGPVLFVRVEENPPIREVVLRGVGLVERRPVREVLAQENLIEAGIVYNSARAQEAVGTLQAIYRQLGFPGAVPVTLEVRPVGPNTQGTSEAAEAATGTASNTATAVNLEDAEAVRLVYTVDETPPIDTVTFAGATVLGEDTLREIFRPLESADTFDLQVYLSAVQEVAEAYAERGFRGSGVDREETALTDGTLSVALQELTILSLDTTAIGVDPEQFSLQSGDLFNYDTLLADVQRLAEGRREDIRIEEPQPIGSGVRVVFSAGPPESAGPIERIAIEGNTVFTDAELRLQLQLRPGETFTSALATEDFARLLEFYAQEGYLLVPEPNFDFLGGAYVQRLREVKIAGYQVDLQTENPRTKDEVITRYLPDVGSVYNQEEMEQGVAQINQLQIVRLGQVQGRVSHALIPTENPEQQLVRFIAQEIPGRTITPSAELTTEGGVSFGADVAVSDTNLFGEAHSASASLNAGTSDIGFLLGGSLAYTVPWLYLDFLDFQEVPTNVSAEIFSETLSNQPLSVDGRRRVRLNPDGNPDNESDCTDSAEDGEDSDENSDDCVAFGEYTQRDSGFRFSVGRPIIPNLSANVSARLTQSDYFVESPEEPCDPATPSPGCSLPLARAQAYAPQSGFSSFLGSTFAYDTRDNPQFAREGYRFTVGGGIGFGNDYSVEGVQQGYTYEQLEVGARTYLTPFENDSHVFAFRFNAGHQFGDDYPDSRLFIVGDTNIEATQLRGYRREDIDPSRSYAAATAEYRYDFGLSTAVTQTVVGIGFVDVGYASSVPDFADYNTPLLLSVGAAVQLNIGFGGGLALPPLRFDYGFSPKNPTGVFGFRLGFNF